jgi:hypothetical protein
MMRQVLRLLGVAVAAAVLLGCGSTDVKVTKEEESNFRNPSLTPPDGASNITGPPPGAQQQGQ